MTYLDANVFIYAAINNDEKGDLCREILRKLAFKKIKGHTSFLTWDEIVYIIRKNKDKETAIKEGKNFLKFPNLSLLKIDEKIINKAQEIIENYNLKPRDAIHVATALVNGINEIISDDSDFDKIKDIKRIKLEDFSKLE